MIKELEFLFSRDFDRLNQEISKYENESDLWIVKKEINNSAGNLALHILGNLRHFIGFGLGGTAYVRDREFEFTAKNVSREQLSAIIEECRQELSHTWKTINQNSLEEPFPIQVFKESYTTGRMLIHLQGHLNYHLGQINYHRRLLTSAQ